MKLTQFDLAIFIAYMLAVLGLGLYAARRGTKTKRDYSSPAIACRGG